MQIRLDRFCQDFRQEGSESFEPRLLIFLIAASPPLNHANLVIRALDECPRHLVARCVMRRDAVLVSVDLSRKLLKVLWPFPLEWSLKEREGLTGSAFTMPCLCFASGT